MSYHTVSAIFLQKNVCFFRYVSYWRTRLRNNALKEFCSTVLVDIEKDGEILKDQEYFLLSDVLPEDRQLREGLQQQRLVSRLS